MDDISTVSQNYNSHSFSAVYYIVNNLQKSTSVTHHLTTQLPFPLATEKLVFQLLHFDPEFRFDLVAIVTGVCVGDSVGVHVDSFWKFLLGFLISLKR